MQTKATKIQKEESQLGQTLAGYIAYWPLFILCLVLSFGAALLYVRYAVPQYEANAKLMIKDKKKGVEESKSLEQLKSISQEKIIENEVEVLQSRDLADSVVMRLKLYAQIFQEGKLNKQSAYTTSPVVAELANPDRIQPIEKIPLRYDAKSGAVFLNVGTRCKIDEWTKTPYGEIRFQKNPYFVEPLSTKPFFMNLVNVRDVSAGILGNLKVVAEKNSSVLELSFRDAVPEKAEDILDNLIDFYNNSAINEKNSLVRNTINSIRARLNVTRVSIDSIEQRVQKYKADNKAVELTTQGSLILDKSGNTELEIGKVDVQLYGLNQLENEVSRNGVVGVLPSGVGISDGELSKQMSDLSTKQSEYERKKQTIGEGHPELQALKEDINAMKPKILSYIKTQRRNLEASRNNLSSTSGRFNSMLTNLPQKERQLLEISRDLDIQNGIYAFLLQKLEESELSYTNANEDSKVINFAQAGRIPVSPKKMMIYLASLLFGLALPILLINGREVLNNKVLYRKEIESYTNIPVIGEIIHNKNKTSLVLEPGKRTFIAEEFRKIRVSLLFLGIDSYHKKILVTSSIPGEGKSFIAANLAVSLAMTGKRVVLVDGDLHNPSLGKLFNVSTEEIGVSDFLLGEKTGAEIIRKMPAHDNLHFISSGGLHPTPSELLENGQMENLISYLESIFDIVVIDTAPVVLVTDAYHLSSLCDATLYVVRHKYTPKMLVKRIDENNKINSLKNPAIIFNGVKTRGFVENNYGYGYDYVYGSNEKITKGKKLKA